MCRPPPFWFAWLLLLAGWSRPAFSQQVHPEAVSRGPVAGAQRNADIEYHAADDQFLVVWDDKRPTGDGQENLWARILPGNGKPRTDLTAFEISGAAGEQKRPAVVATSNGFLVFWEDRRNSSDVKGPRDVYAAHVSPAGAVSPTIGIPVGVDTADESDVEAAGNSSGALAVWERSGAHGGLIAVRASAVGTIIPGSSFSLTTGQDQEPALAANEAGFFVVWERSQTGRRIMAAFVPSAADSPPGPEFEVGPYLDGEAEPEVIWTGSHFLVSWSYRGTDNDPATIVGRRMNPDGTSPDGLAVTLASGVQAKERAMLQQSDGTYLLTVNRPQTDRTLQARRISYGPVLEISPPWNLTDPTVEVPQDPAVASRSGNGSQMVWEDRRGVSGPANEDIWIKPFTLAFTLFPDPAQLVSEAVEVPIHPQPPVLAGQLFGWRHEGGAVASGLVVQHLASRGSRWFPAMLPSDTFHAQVDNAPTTFALLPDAALWRGTNGKLEAARFGVSYNYPEYEERMGVSPTIPDVQSMDAAGWAQRDEPGWPGYVRPSTVAFLSGRGKTVSCYLSAVPSAGGMTPVHAGTVTLPAEAGVPDPAWGVKLAAYGTRLAVLVTAGNSTQQIGGENISWVRLAGWEPQGLVFLTDWIPLGTAVWTASPVLSAHANGAVIFMFRTEGTGAPSWRARRLNWAGGLSMVDSVLQLHSTSLSVVRNPKGFLGFQNLIGGVGGGEIRVTEWDPDLRTTAAWQWEEVILFGRLAAQTEGDAVRLMGSAGQALWRPLSLNSPAWDQTTRTFSVQVRGPAGMNLLMRHGRSPAALGDYVPIRIEPPGGWAGLFDREAGTTIFRYPAGFDSLQFFRPEASLLRQVFPIPQVP